MEDNINIKYQVRISNETMLDTLTKFKMSGLDDERIKILLDCIGKFYCRCASDNKSIDYYIEYLKKSLKGDINEGMESSG